MSENKLKTMRLGGIGSRVQFKLAISEATAILEGKIKDMTSAGIAIVANGSSKEYLVRGEDIVKYLDPPTEVTKEVERAPTPVVAETSGTEEGKTQQPLKKKSRREQAVDKWMGQANAAKRR